MQKHAGRRPGSDVKELSEAMLAALQGGLLLAQVTRSTRPLEVALDMAIDAVAARLKLKAPRKSTKPA